MADQSFAEEAVVTLDLPNLDDIEHPILRRALERVRQMLRDEDATSTYNKHHNRHDSSGSPYW